jgi:hypothetical protein
LRFRFDIHSNTWTEEITHCCASWAIRGLNQTLDMRMQPDWLCNWKFWLLTAILWVIGAIFWLCSPWFLHFLVACCLPSQYGPNW